jgi:hypothetical protein
MTIYGKIENNIFVPAPCGDEDDLMSQGYIGYEDSIANSYLSNQLIARQIEEIDKKRIRALAEGGDHPDGGTWLEYYNLQVEELRRRIVNI